MKTRLAWLMMFTVVACGGAGGTDLGDGGSDSGADSTTPADASTNDAATDSPTDTGGDGAACPNESGKYSVTFTGAGCGPVGSSSPVCIQETSCTITLSSGTVNEISGTTPIGADGSFSGATINEGTANRTGCVGKWDSGSSTLTIDCGGMNTSQSCRATLMRTADTCM